MALKRRRTYIRRRKSYRPRSAASSRLSVFGRRRTKAVRYVVFKINIGLGDVIKNNTR